MPGCGISSSSSSSSAQSLHQFKAMPSRPIAVLSSVIKCMLRPNESLKLPGLYDRGLLKIRSLGFSTRCCRLFICATDCSRRVPCVFISQYVKQYQSPYVSQIASVTKIQKLTALSGVQNTTDGQSLSPSPTCHTHTHRHIMTHTHT